VYVIAFVVVVPVLCVTRWRQGMLIAEHWIEHVAHVLGTAPEVRACVVS
jgi:hypothetical protein